MKVLLYFLIFFSILSCNKSVQKKTLEEKTHDNITKVLIQFYPSFHLPSQIYCDITTGEIIFQRIGAKKHLEVTPLPLGKVIERHAPQSIKIDIETKNLHFLTDLILIKFNETDYIDKSEEYEDGIGNSILYVFNSGEIKDIELTNSFTENQLKLIRFLIMITAQKHTDSLAIKYLHQIEEYY